MSASPEMIKYVEDTINSNKVVVFSKTYCPYCVRAKDLLKKLKHPFLALELDNMDNGDAIQAAIIKKYHHSTVPVIFIDKEFIGGCDDMQALHRKNELVPKLEKAFTN